MDIRHTDEEQSLTKTIIQNCNKIILKHILQFLKTFEELKNL